MVENATRFSNSGANEPLRRSFASTANDPEIRPIDTLTCSEGERSGDENEPYTRTITSDDSEIENAVTGGSSLDPSDSGSQRG